ncbi:MAG: hypothetical protein ACYCOU_16550 [Sulfobacillus sp.]
MQTQRGGNGSGFVNSFHAPSINNVQIYSKDLQQHLDQLPMFNPFSKTAMPYGPTGIIPAGPVFLECKKKAKRSSVPRPYAGKPLK